MFPAAPGATLNITVILPLFDSNPRNVVAPVTLTVIVANMALFAFQMLLARQGSLEVFIVEHAFIAASVGSEPPSMVMRTVFTSMFLHAGILHLAANLWFLFIFGPPVEHRLGSAKTFLLYFLSGAGAAAAQFAISPSSTIPMIGASGAIAGVLGAYLLRFPFSMVITLVPWLIPILPIPGFVFILIWFSLQFYMGLSQLMQTEITAGIAWWAHIGGFLTGMVLTTILPDRRRRR